ncbi:Uracil-DNA glycosylase, family 1 [uncultured Candidatus Thioglobus sp.]|nr:Uracil-DNA glycosylase, family 1 [uncultured Candidatus Thioglobus sp.]
MNWHPQVDELFQSDFMQQLETFLHYQKKAGKIILPEPNNRFKAFELTPFDAVKVVILGQDPYHGEGQAMGLSFSVPDGVKTPPSLKNIYLELESDLGIPVSNSGNLEHWAKQGVLLLNSVLTVEKNAPSSHSKSNWVNFTDGVIEVISREKTAVVFLLWGAYAQQKSALIDKGKHLVLTAAHPSPFSAYKGFFGCKHFSQANDYLEMHNLKAINW